MVTHGLSDFQSITGSANCSVWLLTAYGIRLACPRSLESSWTQGVAVCWIIFSEKALMPLNFCQWCCIAISTSQLRRLVCVYECCSIMQLVAAPANWLGEIYCSQEPALWTESGIITAWQCRPPACYELRAIDGCIFRFWDRSSGACFVTFLCISSFLFVLWLSDYASFSEQVLTQVVTLLCSFIMYVLIYFLETDQFSLNEVQLHFWLTRFEHYHWTLVF